MRRLNEGRRVDNYQRGMFASKAKREIWVTMRYRNDRACLKIIWNFNFFFFAFFSIELIQFPFTSPLLNKIFKSIDLLWNLSWNFCSVYCINIYLDKLFWFILYDFLIFYFFLLLLFSIEYLWIYTSTHYPSLFDISRVSYPIIRYLAKTKGSW